MACSNSSLAVLFVAVVVNCFSGSELGQKINVHITEFYRCKGNMSDDMIMDYIKEKVCATAVWCLIGQIVVITINRCAGDRRHDPSSESSGRRVRDLDYRRSKYVV